MRNALALLRASFLTRASYRLHMAMGIVTLLFQMIPTYYIGHTLQPFMGKAVSGEGGEYFAFLVLGTASFVLLAAAVDALPREVSDGLTTGTFEALFSTPASLTSLLVGLSLYEVLWAFVRALLYVAAALLFGMTLAWSRIPAALLILVLVTLAYYGIGLLAAALIIAFRRAGPIRGAAVLASGLLGGVSYPTTMIPEGLRWMSDFVPLTYGLRALRRTLLEASPVSDSGGDLAMLCLFALVTLSVGTASITLSLRHARRSGSLAQY